LNSAIPLSPAASPVLLEVLPPFRSQDGSEWLLLLVDGHFICFENI